MNIENLVEWSAPVEVNTARGPRTLRTAVPGPVFWAAWRSSKSELQSQGVSCRKDRDGNWESCHWGQTEIAPAYPAGAKVAAPAPAPVAAPAPKSAHAWSPEQEAIFSFFRSPGARRNLVVRARAGTGKTTTIKAAFSVAPEASMLYAVFNKKNQVEAQAAISDPRVEIKTLHSLGFMFIKGFWSYAKPDDSVEKARAIKVCGKSAPDEAVSQLVKLVAFAKNCYVNPTLAQLVDLCDARGIDCADYEDMGWTVERLAGLCLDVLKLSMELDPENRISFNDMVWLPVAQGWVHPMFDLVCVDEAQDMNLPQLMMARGACRPEGRVIVVGDDRQAIYGFRGAASDGMNMMARELDAEELGLTITYRCPKAVVAMAARIVPDYRAADAAPEGEVDYIGASILERSAQVGDAILSRVNAPLMPICLGLLRAGIPARIEGRDIGKQLLGIVRSLKAKSVPHFIGRVNVWAQKQKNRVRRGEHAESRCEMIEDQAGVLIAIAEGASAVSEIEGRIEQLFQDSDGFSRPAVVLSSVHKAKGLEWNRVYLLSETFKRAEGLTEGEEANVYYVAMTRAKKSLVFVSKERPNGE